MSAGSFAADGRGAMFFLSYAHAPRSVRRNDPTERPVRDFFRDLSEEVARLAETVPGLPVAFADWHIPTGHNWRKELGKALGTCGVFVALYSPKYFESPVCGQEWAAFHRREHLHFAQTKEDKTAIVPVMWNPMEDGHMPPVATRIHYQLSGAGDLYRRRGMRELVMRSGNREEFKAAYRTALTAFAEHIVQVARSSPLSEAHNGELELNPDENAFEGKWDKDDPRPLRFVVVAPVQGQLPARANPDLYGISPELWRPYWPDDDAPIARTATMLGASDGFHPIIEFMSSCPDLRDGEGPTAPTVLIVDPWSAQDTELGRLLHAFDQVSHTKPWVRLVIPWDKNSSGGGGQVLELENGLERALNRMRSNCRMANPEAVAGLDSVAAFGDRLPGVIAAAERGYFRRTTAYLSLEEGRELPRLGGGPAEGPLDGQDNRGRGL